MTEKMEYISTLAIVYLFVRYSRCGNLSRVYCQRCQESHLHVVVIPEDIPCPCTHGCACCHQKCHNAHKKNCDNAKQEHTYYKVSGDWAMSHFEVQFCDMVQECQFHDVFTGYGYF